jgi:hypothetical protein
MLIRPTNFGEKTTTNKQTKTHTHPKNIPNDTVRETYFC